MDAEEYDSDLDDINGDDPPKRRIRKRTSTVTMACNQCREKHLKCDGAQPVCGRCTRLSMGCVFETKRRKRGPKKGMLQELAQSVSVLSHTLVSLTQPGAPVNAAQLALSNPIVAAAAASQPLSNTTTNQVLSGTASALLLSSDTRLGDTFLLSEYLRAYKQYLEPMLAVSAPYPAAELTTATALLDESKLMLEYIVLAHGARCVGHRNQSEEFLLKTRHLAGKYFDQSSGHVAGAMFLLSYFFTGSGDLPKAIYYNEIAVNMLEQLLIAQKALNETPDPNLLHVFANCLFAQVDSAPSLERQNVLLDAFMGKLSQFSSHGKTFEFFTALISLSRIYCATVVAPASQASSLLSQLVTCGESFPLEFRREPAFRCRLEPMTKASAVVLYAKAGMNDLAEQLADELHELIRRETFPAVDIFGLSAMWLVAQVRLRNNPDKFQKDLELIKEFGDLFPVAEFVISYLTKIAKEFDNLRANAQPITIIPYTHGWLSNIAVTNPEKLIKAVIRQAITMFANDQPEAAALIEQLPGHATGDNGFPLPTSNSENRIVEIDSPDGADGVFSFPPSFTSQLARELTNGMGAMTGGMPLSTMFHNMAPHLPPDFSLEGFLGEQLIQNFPHFPPQHAGPAVHTLQIYMDHFAHMPHPPPLDFQAQATQAAPGQQSL